MTNYKNYWPPYRPGYRRLHTHRVAVRSFVSQVGRIPHDLAAVNIYDRSRYRVVIASTFKYQPISISKYKDLIYENLLLSSLARWTVVWL